MLRPLVLVSLAHSHIRRATLLLVSLALPHIRHATLLLGGSYVNIHVTQSFGNKGCDKNMSFYEVKTLKKSIFSVNTTWF